MKNKIFKPMLAPNEEINLNDLKYPLLASTKLDGMRIIFYKGQILTRSLKPLPNKQLNEKFEPIREYSEKNNLILDGEIYSHKLTFQEIISYCMTQDFEDKKSIKNFGYVMQIPEHLKFYCFDGIKNDNFDEPFIERQKHISFLMGEYSHLSQEIQQNFVNSIKEIENLFKCVLDNGYEGLILRNPNVKYKCGRGTLKEGLIFKYKPFVTIDSKIIDVIQATVVDPNAEKKINELGRSVTSKKKNDRILIEKASAFLVDYESKQLKVTIAMNDEEKIDVWKNKEKYIGKFVEYKFMTVGMKEGGLPRHPVTIRIREDK